MTSRFPFWNFTLICGWTEQLHSRYYRLTADEKYVGDAYITRYRSYAGSGEARRQTAFYILTDNLEQIEPDTTSPYTRVKTYGDFYNTFVNNGGSSASMVMVYTDGENRQWAVNAKGMVEVNRDLMTNGYDVIQAGADCELIPNNNGVRPSSITLTLLADGTPVAATPTWSNTDTDDWTYTFRGPNAVTAAGIAITYTVQERQVPYYETRVSGTTITNTLIPAEPEAYVALTGTKTWDDDGDSQGLRPGQITVRLLRDGEEIDRIVVTDADGWRYSFGELPADDGYGNAYTYEIREDGVFGYFAEVRDMDLINALLLREMPSEDSDAIPKGVVTVENRETGTPVPRFADYTEAELETMYNLFSYDTPLWGMMKTGDETPAWPFAFAGAGALALIALAVLKKKRKA